MAAPRPMCIGIPVDHRFGKLPVSRLREDVPRWIGNHAQIIEGYGRTHRRNPSIQERNFAKWLSLPETKGGVLIVLQQPAEFQQYFDDHATTVERCASLKAINDVCKTMTGHDLAQVSCFDAFPFQTSLWNKMPPYTRDEQFDEAYETFLMMVSAKEPDLILCCYQSPHDTKYTLFQSRGVRSCENFRARLDGREYFCVNGFHPGYAINHNKTSSVLRNLLIAKISHAFCLADGSNRLDTLVVDLSDRRQEYQEEKKRLGYVKDKDDEHELRNFQCNINKLKLIFDGFERDRYFYMKDDEMYRFLFENQFSAALQDCALLLESITPSSLGRQTANICKTFLYSFIRTSTQRPAGRTVGVVPADSRKIVHDTCLKSFMSKYWQRNLGLCMTSLVTDLDNAYTGDKQGFFDFDHWKLHEAFRSAATSLEDIMSSLWNNGQSASDPLDFDICAGFASLTITGPNITKPVTGAMSSLLGSVYPYSSGPYASNSYASNSYTSSSYTSNSYTSNSYTSNSYTPNSYAPNTYAPSSYAPNLYGPSSDQANPQTVLLQFAGPSQQTIVPGSILPSTTSWTYPSAAHRSYVSNPGTFQTFSDPPYESSRYQGYNKPNRGNCSRCEYSQLS